jgi:hypothetical protein
VPVKCRGLSGRLFGHKFEPRMDTRDLAAGPPDHLVSELSSQTPYTHKAEVLAELGCSYSRAAEYYVQDVCVRCGAVVPRCCEVFPLNDLGEGESEADPERVTNKG